MARVFLVNQNWCLYYSSTMWRRRNTTVRPQNITNSTPTIRQLPVDTLQESNHIWTCWLPLSSWADVCWQHWHPSWVVGRNVGMPQWHSALLRPPGIVRHDRCYAYWQCSMAKCHSLVWWSTSWAVAAMDGKRVYCLVPRSTYTFQEYAQESGFCWIFWLYSVSTVQWQGKASVWTFHVW